MRVTTVILSVCLVGCSSVPQPRSAAPGADATASAVRAIHRPHRAPPPRIDPPPVVAPAPQLVGAGMGVLLNVVDSDPIVAFDASDGAHVVDLAQGSAAIYSGTLEDLQNGVALTEISSDTAPDQLLLNGNLALTQIVVTHAVIAGPDIAYIAGGNVVALNGNALPSPPGDLVELAASGTFVAWALENDLDCAVYLNSVFVSNTPECPFDLKVTAANGIVYVGWSDGTGVHVAESSDSGATWAINTVFSGGTGVYGDDYAVRADGSLIVVWLEYIASEGGSSVWESDSGGGLPVRLSSPVIAGFAGAGNPKVASDGSVVWLDDIHGSASGDYDVFLNGADLSTVDEATQGPVLRLKPDGTRVVAWDDGTNVWLEQIPN